MLVLTLSLRKLKTREEALNAKQKERRQRHVQEQRDNAARLQQHYPYQAAADTSAAAAPYAEAASTSVLLAKFDERDAADSDFQARLIGGGMFSFSCCSALAAAATAPADADSAIFLFRSVHCLLDVDGFESGGSGSDSESFHSSSEAGERYRTPPRDTSPTKADANAAAAAAASGGSGGSGAVGATASDAAAALEQRLARLEAQQQQQPPPPQRQRQPSPPPQLTAVPTLASALEQSPQPLRGRENGVSSSEPPLTPLATKVARGEKGNVVHTKGSLL